MSDSIAVTADYNELLDSIKRTLAAGQLRAARAVNNILVETYWQIGRDINATLAARWPEAIAQQPVARYSASLSGP